MKKRIISSLIVLALCFALVPPVATAEIERGIARFEQIIDPQYQDIGLFSDGLASVMKDGKWGYIDIENNTVIPFEYDYACIFSEGYAVVGKLEIVVDDTNEPDADGGYSSENTIESEVMYIGRVDAFGNYRPFSFQQQGRNDENRDWQLCFEIQRWDPTLMFRYFGGWVHIGGELYDTNGDKLRTSNGNRYRAMHIPTEGLVAAWDESYDYGSGVRYLDSNGEVALDLSGNRYYDTNGMEVTRSYNDGDQVRYLKFISAGMPFNQGLAPVWEATYDYYAIEWSHRLGFIDKDGTWVIKPQFSDYYVAAPDGRYQVFSDSGLASLAKDGTFGAVDKAGNTVIPFRYDALWSFFEGLAVFVQDGLYGYVDETGNEVIPAKFTAATGFSNGFAVVSDGINTMLIDRSGNPIPGTEMINLSVYNVEHGDGSITSYTPGEHVAIVSGGNYGIGRLIYPPPLPEISEMDSWAYAEVLAAINADLVPASLQNRYRSNITRGDYCSLIINAVCKILEVDRDDLVRQHTGSALQRHIAAYPFTDTTDYDVIAAYALELVTGYSESGGKYSFRPNDLIVRQEAAVLLWRAAGLLGMDTTEPEISVFADRSSIPDWALTQVDYAASIGVLRGIDEVTFSPDTYFSRQQSFITVIRLFHAMLAENGQ